MYILTTTVTVALTQDTYIRFERVKDSLRSLSLTFLRQL